MHFPGKAIEDGAARHTPHANAIPRTGTMPLRLQKKATRVVRAVVEEVNVARGVGTRTDKRGNAKTSLWDHGKVRLISGFFSVALFSLLTFGFGANAVCDARVSG